MATVLISFASENVQFETCGIGVTDLDCELKFSFGGQLISIDIKKKLNKKLQLDCIALRLLCQDLR